MLPVCAPVGSAAEGTNVTLTLHVLPAATAVVHPVAVNSGLLLDRVIGIAAVVLFFTVKFLAALVLPCATEPNVIEVLETVTGVAPVPLRAAVSGLPTPVYATERLPVCAPVVVGLKVTLIEQVEFAATEAHVFVSAKGAAAEIVSAAAAV
jgi:hypothetical protein